MDQPPLWVSIVTILVSGGAIGAAVTLVGLFANTWIKMRRANADIKAKGADEEAKHEEAKQRRIEEQKRSDTDLAKQVKDDQIAKWKEMAAIANARADRKEEEYDKRILAIIERYQGRESAMMKQHEERELQFGSIIDRIRGEYDVKLSAQAREYDNRLTQMGLKHEDCVTENAELKGRIIQLEANYQVRGKQIDELIARLDARDMKKRTPT